jgi:hypothetical protein
MIDGKVLDLANDGSWRLWNYDPKNTRDIFPGGPAAQGQWASIGGGHALITMKDGHVLDWVPGDGSWRLWNYDPKSTRDIFPGGPAAQGQWASIRVGHALFRMRDGRVLDYYTTDGTWRLWNYDPASTGDIFPGAPNNTGKWPDFTVSGGTANPWDDLFVVMNDGAVLDWIPMSGYWRLVDYVDATDQKTGRQFGTFPPPVTNGHWASIGSGHWLVTMSDGNVLDWVWSDGSWRLWKYVR